MVLFKLFFDKNIVFGIKPISLCCGKVFFVDRHNMGYLDRLRLTISILTMTSSEVKDLLLYGVLVVKEKDWAVELISNTKESVFNRSACGVKAYCKNHKFIIMKTLGAVNILEFMDDKLVDFKRVGI